MTRTDWVKWVDCVNTQFRIVWSNPVTATVEDRIDFSAIETMWRGETEYTSVAKIFMDNIQINAHFFWESELENDIDPREFNSFEDHERLINYMRVLSNLLGKEVNLTYESLEEHHGFLVRVSKDTIIYSEYL